MATVLWHVTMSLDGFIAGPDDAMDWVFRYGEPSATVERVIESTGSMLAGRRSYDVGKRDAGKQSGEPYGGGWSGPQFVLTHHAPASSEDSLITFLSCDIRTAVASALDAAGGKNVVIIGADIARQCIDAGLVDEVLVHLAPVLLGGGVRLFDDPDAVPIDLETISVQQSGQLTDLRYRVLPLTP